MNKESINQYLYWREDHQSDQDSVYSKDIYDNLIYPKWFSQWIKLSNSTKKIHQKLTLKITHINTNNNLGIFLSRYWLDIKETYNFYTFLCPFHKEDTPSCRVSKSKLMYKCFGCGKWWPICILFYKLKYWYDASYNTKNRNDLEKDIDWFLTLSSYVDITYDRPAPLDIYNRNNSLIIDNEDDLDLPF